MQYDCLLLYFWSNKNLLFKNLWLVWVLILIAVCLCVTQGSRGSDLQVRDAIRGAERVAGTSRTEPTCFWTYFIPISSFRCPFCIHAGAWTSAWGSSKLLLNITHIWPHGFTDIKVIFTFICYQIPLSAVCPEACVGVEVSSVSGESDSGREEMEMLPFVLHPLDNKHQRVEKDFSELMDWWEVFDSHTVILAPGVNMSEVKKISLSFSLLIFCSRYNTKTTLVSF